MIKDNGGNWIKGFAINLSSCTITKAELKGLFEGLTLVCSLGTKILIVEVDNLYIINMIKGNNGGNKVALFWLRKSYSCWPLIGYQETNYVTNNLVAYGQHISFGIHILDEMPSDSLHWMQHDMVGIAYPRMICKMV